MMKLQCPNLAYLLRELGRESEGPLRSPALVQETPHHSPHPELSPKLPRLLWARRRPLTVSKLTGSAADRMRLRCYMLMVHRED